MDIQLIKKLIQLVNDNNVGELKIKEGDFKIEITHKDFVKQQNITTTTSVPSSTVVATPTMVESNNTTPKANESVVADNVKTIKSPMIGTFYRSSDPDKEPFVKVGDKAKIRIIKTGIQDDTNIEVTEGIQKGDVIIIGPYTTVTKDLNSGDKVKVASKTNPAEPKK